MIIDPKFPFAEQMIKDNFDPKYIISEDLYKKTSDFAKASAPTSQNKYAARGQNDVVRIMSQIQAGKIGEQAIHGKFITYLTNLSEPDYEIYGAKQKNWNPDLSDTTADPIITIGSKAQEYQQSLLFGESWVCEYRENAKFDRDTGIFSEEAKKPGHFICCTLINVPKRWVELKAIVAISTLHEKRLFEPMVKKNLQSNKLAIYMESIERVFA
jgi:hypothetical protein